MKLLSGAVVVLGLLGSILYVSVFGWHRETTDGEHTGYITSVERSGVFFKTFRVYLKTDLESSQEDSYCVVDPEVYAQLEQLAQQSTQVTVSYFSWLAAGIKNCDGESAVIYHVIRTEDIAQLEADAQKAVLLYQGDDDDRQQEVMSMAEEIKKFKGRDARYSEIEDLLKALGRIN